MLMAISTGTNVNSLDTSKDMMPFYFSSVLFSMFFYMVDELFFIIDVVGGLANQEFEYSCQLFGYHLCNRAPAGNWL